MISVQGPIAVIINFTSGFHHEKLDERIYAVWGFITDPMKHDEQKKVRNVN